MQSKRPSCHVMVGLPYSGKSTYAEQIGDTVLSTDAIIERLCAGKGMSYGEGFEKYIDEATKFFNQQVDTCIQGGISFVWDQTNLSKKKRAGIISRLRRTHDVICVQVIPSPETFAANQAKRTDKVIAKSILKRMEATYDQPDLSEGFLRLVKVHTHILPDGFYESAIIESERLSVDALAG